MPVLLAACLAVVTAAAAAEDLPAASRTGARPRPSGRLASTITLRAAVDTGTFARYLPFDAREVTVRRGGEMGFHYGLELSRRRVRLDGGTFDLVRYRQILSPPISRPGEPPMSADAAQRYAPEGEVLYLPDAEVYIPRVPLRPDGFTDAEVQRILAAISVRRDDGP